MLQNQSFRNFFRISVSYWLLVPSVLYETIPWLSYRVRAIVPFGFVMLWMFVNVHLIMQKFNTREGRVFRGMFFWFVCLTVLPEVFAIFGTHNHMTYNNIAGAATQIVYLVLAFYTIAARKFNELRFLTIISLVGFVIAGISALKGYNIEGMESGRTMVLSQMEGVTLAMLEGALIVMDSGLGGYGYIYVCAWVTGIVLISIALTRSFRLRLFYGIVGLSSLLSVKMGGLGTPVAIVAIEFALFACWVITMSRKILLILGVCLIVVFFIYASTPSIFGFLAPPFEELAESMSDGSIKDRIMSLADAFRGVDSYAQGRAQMQMKSFWAFCKHPFLGVFGPVAGGSYLDLGGHSYLLDLIGGYGLLGLSVFVMFIRGLMKYFNVISSLYFGNRWKVLPVFYVVIFIFSGIMNPVTFFANVVYLLPGLAYLSLRQEDMPMPPHNMLPPHLPIYVSVYGRS